MMDSPNLAQRILAAAALQNRRNSKPKTQIGPGRRSVFTHARAIAKRAKSRYPMPFQGKKERARPHFFKEAA